MVKGILAKKIGMTQVFDDAGDLVPGDRRPGGSVRGRASP